MTGKELKNKLLGMGKSMTDVANALGISSQHLNSLLLAADVRTGLIERLCAAFDMQPSDFLGGAPSANATNNSVAFNGDENNVSVSVDATLVGVIDRQSKQISDLIGILAKQNNYIQ